MLMNAGSIMGKEVLDLENGAIIGRVYGITLTSDCKIAGLKIRERKYVGPVYQVPFENVKAFGATITVSSIGTVTEDNARDCIGKTVIGVDGDTFGKVEELAFDQETGVLAEIVVVGDLMDTVQKGHGLLDADKVLSIGKDVVIVAAGIKPEDFTAAGEEFYGDWKKMDAVLDEIDAETNGVDSDQVKFDEESFEFETEAERIGTAFEETIESFAKTMEDALGRLRNEFIGEKTRKQGDRIIDRFSDEAKNVFHSMQDIMKDVDTTEWKDNLKNMANRKNEPEETLATDLEKQMEDLTVEKPVLDEEGNVIVWPGQIIGKEEIKEALRAGVLQNLLDLATVSLKTEEEQSEEIEEAESDKPEIEVEVFVDEDAFPSADDAETVAFIAEEAAKMELAEAAEEVVEAISEVEAAVSEVVDDATECICDLPEEE